MNALSFVALSLALTVAAQARLGETLAECRKRYGKELVVNEETKTILFNKNGFSFLLGFGRDGKASMVMIEKDAEEGLEAFGNVLDDEEIETFKKASSGGSEWKKLPGEGLQQIWGTLDDKAIAMYQVLEGRLTLMTRAQFDAMGKKAEQDKKKVLDGF